MKQIEPDRREAARRYAEQRRRVITTWNRFTAQSRTRGEDAGAALAVHYAAQAAFLTGGQA